MSGQKQDTPNNNLTKVINSLELLSTQLGELTKNVNMQNTEILTKLNSITLRINETPSRAKRGDGSKTATNGSATKKVFPINSLSWFTTKYKSDKGFVESNYITEEQKKKVEKYMEEPNNKDLKEKIAAQFHKEKAEFDESSKKTLKKEEGETEDKDAE
jgi:hypothetical protein